MKKLLIIALLFWGCGGIPCVITFSCEDELENAISDLKNTISNLIGEWKTISNKSGTYEECANPDGYVDSDSDSYYATFCSTDSVDITLNTYGVFYGAGCFEDKYWHLELIDDIYRIYFNSPSGSDCCYEDIVYLNENEMVTFIIPITPENNDNLGSCRKNIKL